MRRSKADERVPDRCSTDGMRSFPAQRDEIPATGNGETMSLQQQSNREQASRRSGDRNWSARIRASIVRLLEIDGVRLDRDTRRETVQKLEEWQQLQDRVDRVEAASNVAHSVYWDTLRDGYTPSRPEPNAKRMRMMKPSELSSTRSARQPRHEALDTLVLAAAAEQSSEQAVLPKAKPSKRGGPHKHPLLIQGEAGSLHHPLPVHDRQVVKAVDKLSGKLTQLLSQVQAASDAALAEPLLASAAIIALEATQMLRCEEVAMARMMEIEEHRQKIVQGLEEYALRKEKRKANDKRGVATPSSLDSPEDASTSPPPAEPTNAQNCM